MLNEDPSSIHTISGLNARMTAVSRSVRNVCTQRVTLIAIYIPIGFQTVRIVIHNGVHFPSEHSFTNVATAMLSYGWTCSLFGCYRDIGSVPRYYAVSPAVCIIGMSRFSTLFNIIPSCVLLQMKMNV